MSYSVELTFFAPTLLSRENRHVFRLRCVVSDAVNTPAEIFLHQKTLVDPVTELLQDEFIAICSAYDLSTYPANAPNAEQDPPFFRKSVIDILLPSVDVYEEVKAAIQTQVAELLRVMAALDELLTADVITITEP